MNATFFCGGCGEMGEFLEVVPFYVELEWVTRRDQKFNDRLRVKEHGMLYYILIGSVSIFV